MNLKEKANFTRVCLLVDKGGDALRAALHAIHPPSTLAAALKANESDLQKIKNTVITDQQWDLLFPTSPDAAPDSKKFDITLLTILLRNICRLSPPATGWNVMPPVADTSIPADIVRIKLFRNEVYHIGSARLDDAKFEELWQEISQPLVRLGILQKDIDEIRKEEESCLPDKLSMFTGREDEIQNVIALLLYKTKAVVSLHGGPGFGKTAIAIQVSHKLSEDHKIPVVFSQLTTATKVDEMIRQLCLDVSVNHEDDPKSSFIMWLKNIKSKLIFVMDDIDNLLEDKTSFNEFIRLLRKNSNQHCQILTTSRIIFEIPDLPTDKIQVDKMDEEACTELLKKQCPEQDDKFLRRLAKLCGNIPLAMCIAGSLVDDFENPDELLQHLEKQPMKTLKRPNSNQYVNRAINLSYEKCSDEEQETFIRLSVFEESFSNDAAKAVIEKDSLDTNDILQKLVSRSLIKEPTKRRYIIHLLIKHFLNDKQKGEDEKAQKAREEAMRAEVLMVEFYLELGHDKTMKSYSKDGYKDSREALKREASNIQNVLKICCQQEDPTRSDISDCLARSKIYTTSVKFFSLFVRTMIPDLIVDNFLQRCANLAEERKEHAIKINVDCLLADRERSKSVGKSDEHYISKMDKIQKDFETHYEVLKEDKALCAHYYYQYFRYLFRKADNQKEEERLKIQIEIKEKLEKWYEIMKTLTDTPGGKADIIYSLLHLGHTYKSISSTECYLKDVSSETSLERAENCYKEAIQLSQKELGEHELTSSCHKYLGDLFSKIDMSWLRKSTPLLSKSVTKWVLTPVKDMFFYSIILE